MKEPSVKEMHDREFLSYLATLDVRLERNKDSLRCNAPEGVLTALLKTELARRKAAILDLLLDTEQEPGEPRQLPTGRTDLSPVQKRLLLLASHQSTTEMHHIATAFRLRGPLDITALQSCLGWLQQRHDILRTVFPSSGPEPEANVLEGMDVSPVFVDLRGHASDTREDRMWEQINSSMQQNFDLDTGPLWRVSLLTMDDNDHVLLFVMHHIVFDGWSKNVLIKDLEEAYEAFSLRGEPPSSPPPKQYGDYAAWRNNWLEGTEAANQATYWKKVLAGAVPELWLPTTRSQPNNQKFLSGNYSFDLPDELARALSRLSREYKVSLFITLLAGYNIVLNQYTGQEDLIVCSPVHGRNSVEWERTIGCFNNIVVMRNDLTGDPGLGEVLERTREVVLGAYRHQDFPIQDVSSFQNLVRTTLTRSMFSLRNAQFHTLSLPGIEVERMNVRKLTADFDLAAYMEQGPAGLRGTLEYNKDLFDLDTVEDFAASFQRALEALATLPNRRLSQLQGPTTRTLADVEKALRAHHQVEDAAVIAASPGEHDEAPRVIAYIVANQYDVPSHHDLREYLKQMFPAHLVPSVLVPVDGLILTESGEVDRSALPAPPTDLRAATYVGPRTDLERELTEIWTRVLWLDREIGVRDNFFDLGGHSLLSAQLFHEIEQALGRPLTSQTLYQLTTVEDLARLLEENEPPNDNPQAPDGTLSPRVAALLESSRLEHSIYQGLLAHISGWKGQRVASDSLIVGLNTDGHKQQLFWCCQGFRELSQLARYLGTDQPVYGMRSGHRLIQRSDANEEALAAYYAGEILAVQPRGPFLVGGNCQAGIIAFKIAKRLLALGHQVSLLCLQERFVPEHYPGRVTLLYGNDSNRSPRHYLNQSPETWKKFYTGTMSVHFIDGRHGEFFREPNINTLSDRLASEIELAKASREEAPQTEPIRARLPEAACRASISAPQEVTARPGEAILMKTRIRNDSTETWPRGAVSLGYRLKDPGGRFDITTDPGDPLAGDLAPGDHIETRLRIPIPEKKGVYRIELDLLDSGLFWFRNRGSSPARVIVIVRWKSKLGNAVWDGLRRVRNLLTGFTGRASHRTG